MSLFKSTRMDQEPEIGTIGTMIGPDALFEGKLVVENSICIAGRVIGRIEARGSVLINETAFLEAEVFADSVVVHGEIQGNITADKQIDIGATGRVRGDVEAPSVTLARGAFLDGFCRMGAGTGRPAKAREPAERKSDAEPAGRQADSTEDLPASAKNGQPVPIEDVIIVASDADDPPEEGEGKNRIHIV